MSPTNLTAQAKRDLNAILERSADVFGKSQAELLQERVFTVCADIADGMNHGHALPTATVRRPTRIIVVHPFIIAYNPKTRKVIRIVDGRRDLFKILR